MKKIFVYGFAILMWAGCNNLAQDEIQEQKNTNELVSSEMEIFDLEKRIEFYRQQNEQRLANVSHLKKICDSSIRVPFDYPTIQEAVDNVCDAGTVLVSTGQYGETVFVSKPGLKIMAVGEVKLTGGFVLFEDADDALIQNFKITIGPHSEGIFTFNADNLTISQNEIKSFLGGTGIVLGNSSGSTINKNIISNIDFGINLLTGVGLEPGDEIELISHNNVISNNLIESFGFAGINLYGKLEENSIKNNTIKNSAGYRRFAEGGILLNYLPSRSISSGTCRNNEIKNNKSVNVEIGILIGNSSSGNKISGNEFSNNRRYGIYIDSTLILDESNIFKNNKVQGNGICDIFDSSGLNIYINNKAECMSGL